MPSQLRRLPLYHGERQELSPCALCAPVDRMGRDRLGEVGHACSLASARHLLVEGPRSLFRKRPEEFHPQALQRLDANFSRSAPTLHLAGCRCARPMRSSSTSCRSCSSPVRTSSPTSRGCGPTSRRRRGRLGLGRSSPAPHENDGGGATTATKAGRGRGRAANALWAPCGRATTATRACSQKKQNNNN